MYLPRTKAYVSWSELLTWKTCHMKWFWNYVEKIRPIKLNPTIAMGDVGHRLMAARLDPNRKGTISQAQDDVWDAWLKAIAPKGLFDEELDTALEVFSTAKQVVDRWFARYADEFTPLLVEHQAEVPVRGLKTTLLTKWDCVATDTEGHTWLLEFKFPKEQFRSEDDVDLSAQVGTYHWAAHKAKLKVVGVRYIQLLGKLPAEPSRNQNGQMSRKEIRTDWETYSRALVAADLDPNDYLDMQDKLAGKDFFRDYKILRSPDEVKYFAQDLERSIWELVSTKKHIFMCDNAIACRSCGYRELCMEKVRGRDPQGMIDAAFVYFENEPRITHATGDISDLSSLTEED